jgi:hypothetical protein
LLLIFTHFRKCENSFIITKTNDLNDALEKLNLPLEGEEQLIQQIM